MGQCVSNHQPFHHRAVMASAQNNAPSLSDASQDGHSQTRFSNSTIPEHQQQSPLDGVKAVENISEYFDDVARKIPGKKTISMRKSSISSFLPKVKGSLRRPKAEKPSLSAAFNMSFNKFDVVRLDINAATEEELMTLTGINRNIAKEIIEHRNAIGTFKKVEDLALVSGVGAAKMQVIKPEICIGKKVPSSTASIITANASISSLNGNAETASIASSPKPERQKRLRRREPVNINTSTIFQLMTVDGITQELAAHIVHYRERKGPFKTLYDLRKVGGFNSRLISALGPYLTTEAPVSNGQPLQNGHVHTHRRTASLPSGPLLDVGVLCMPSTPVFPKPAVFPSVSQFTRVLDETQNMFETEELALTEEENSPSENALRIMKWNLDGLSFEKAHNPGVVCVMARLLARYHITVAIIQGITDSLGLKELCDGVNKQDTISPMPYSYTMAENGSVGYLHKVTLKVFKPSIVAGCVPLNLVTIEKKDVDFALVDCSLVQALENASTILIPQLVKAVMDLSPTERILCLADFPVEHSSYIEEFQNLGYRAAVSKDESSSLLKKLKDGDQQIHSNFLVSRYAQNALTGKWGVVRDGLTHILIPNGWSWNGPASLYCPIWLELQVEDEEGD